ncbi:hypothetical protein RIEGSTA812A_PEG_1019 [invertebrate metagenome]|uniref:Uncharacterized protein n=1 Tax=invertebrate metagenome TaxID=1711999 RepID=A0A484H632_9ZZZZ
MAAPVAEEQSSCIISDVFVDVTGSSPAEAQQRAFAKAEAKAARQLLERLTIPADHALLPTQISSRIIHGLVRDIAIEAEKTTPMRYAARFSVHFRPEAVQTYLRVLGVSYIEPPTRPVLIIPLFQESTSVIPYVLSRDNLWWQSWKKQTHINRLIPTIIVPSSHTMEQTIPEQAIMVDAVAWKAMARHWHTIEHAVVLQAIVIHAGKNQRLNIVGIRSFHPEDMTPLLIERIIGTTDESLENVLDRAVWTVLNHLETDWRQQHTIWVAARREQEQVLTVVLTVASQADWFLVRRGLGGIPMIIRAELQALTRVQLQLTLWYVGEEVRLAAALAQHGLKLGGRGSVRRLWRTVALPVD